jgi:hypothetical protein
LKEHNDPKDPSKVLVNQTKLDSFLGLNCEPDANDERAKNHFIVIICLLVHIFCMIL